MFDELEKIAEAQPEPIPKKEQVKRWLKNTAIVAAAAGVGAGAVTALDANIHHILGPKWAALSPTTKRLLIGPMLGAATLGGGYYAKKMVEEQQKRLTEPMPKKE